MRIVYLLHLNDRPESGVFKKVIGQAKQWVINHEDVALFLLTREAGEEFWARAAGDIPVFMYRYSSFASRLRRLSQLAKGVLSWHPDLIYFRHDPYYPPYEPLLRKVPLVVEINADDMFEYRLQPVARYWYNRVTRCLLFSKIRGMVFVAQEVSERYHYRRFRKPSIVIANAIDLTEYPTILPAPTNTAPRLVFLSSRWTRWEGVDKILWLAHRFPDWHFDLIGKKQDDVFDTLPSNVSLYPAMPRSEYEEILARADVAIGALACERVNMHEASSLGVRECLALGIPTLVGYHDTDFPETRDFLFELPSTSNNVMKNVALIEQFVQTARGKRVSREAIAHLDVSVKERKRMGFFLRVLSAQEDERSQGRVLGGRKD